MATSIETSMAMERQREELFLHFPDHLADNYTTILKHERKKCHFIVNCVCQADSGKEKSQSDTSENDETAIFYADCQKDGQYAGNIKTVAKYGGEKEEGCLIQAKKLPALSQEDNDKKKPMNNTSENDETASFYLSDCQKDHGQYAGNIKIYFTVANYDGEKEEGCLIQAKKFPALSQEDNDKEKPMNNRYSLDSYLIIVSEEDTMFDGRADSYSFGQIITPPSNILPMEVTM